MFSRTKQRVITDKAPQEMFADARARFEAGTTRSFLILEYGVGGQATLFIRDGEDASKDQERLGQMAADFAERALGLEGL